MGGGALITAVAAGALSIKAIQDWLASLGANALSGWVVNWAAGAAQDALADAAEREWRAADLAQAAAADPAIAAALGTLLQAIDAAPQSLAALQEEVGAQSDVILAQYEAPRRLQADVARLGIAGGALAPATIQEADRVIAAVESRADRGEGKLDQALAELRALRDTQRQALISFAGAQTGDVSIGDVAGRDIHTPSIAPGGIYAPGGMVNVAPASSASAPHRRGRLRRARGGDRRAGHQRGAPLPRTG